MKSLVFILACVIWERSIALKPWSIHFAHWRRCAVGLPDGKEVCRDKEWCAVANTRMSAGRFCLSIDYFFFWIQPPRAGVDGLGALQSS